MQHATLAYNTHQLEIHPLTSRWSWENKRQLANRLNGVVDHATGNIRFTGPFGMPEQVYFHNQKLVCFRSGETICHGEAALKAIRQRIAFLHRYDIGGV